MVSFGNLQIDAHYRSGTHRIGADFYGQLLPRARHFSRAVGYFSSSAFAEATEAFVQFFADNRVMRLVCSPWLSGADAHALSRALTHRPAVRRGLTLDTLRSLLKSGNLS